MDCAQDALVLDPGNRDAWGLLAAAKRALGVTPAQSAAKFPHDATEMDQSEELYRVVTENMMDGISINVDDKRVYVNPAFLSIFGLTDTSEALGISIDTYFADEDKRVLKGRSDARRTGDILPKTERRIIRPDGEVRIIDTLASLITYRGAPARLVLFRDITDRKQAEAELKATQSSLAQAEKLTAIGHMVAGVAHELNNPLTGVLGFSELLLQADLPPEAKNSARMIASEATRAARVVHQLLSFARKQDSQLAFVNLNQVLAQTIELKQRDLQMAGIGVELDLGAGVPPLMADINQLQSVVLNLINNAQFAMTEAHGSGKLLIETSVVKGSVCMSVTDDGPGVKAEDLPKLFDPFFTTKDVGQGTGMGLSICHGIITGLGGRIWAESHRGGGTTFRVEIPITPRLQEPNGPGKARAEAKRKGKGRVFVVDDEPAIREITAAALAVSGYKVETSGSAQEAMEALRDAKPDVVLLDMRMPGIDGRGMWRMLQKSRPDLLTKVVWVTGAAIDSTIEDFVVSTGRPVLDKPFTLEALDFMVREVIEGQQGA